MAPIFCYRLVFESFAIFEGEIIIKEEPPVLKNGGHDFQGDYLFQDCCLNTEMAMKKYQNV